MKSIILKLAVVLLILIIALAALFIVWKSNTIDIGEIRADPGKYLGKECKVKGYVTRVLDIPFTSDDYFKINDETGEIWIFTHRGVPPENKEVKVTGVLERAITIMGIEIGYRIRLREIEFLD